MAKITQFGHFFVSRMKFHRVMLRCHRSCIVCCVIGNQQSCNIGTKNKVKKGLVSYFKNNRIIVLKKHMDANHGLIVKKIEEEMNNNFKSPLKSQLAKKRFVMNASVISNFLGAINPYKKDNVHQKDFVENLGLLVIKNHLPIQFVESIWLKCLVIQLCLHVVFPFFKTFNKKMLPDLVEKTNQTYV